MADDLKVAEFWCSHSVQGDDGPPVHQLSYPWSWLPRRSRASANGWPAG